MLAICRQIQNALLNGNTTKDALVRCCMNIASGDFSFLVSNFPAVFASSYEQFSRRFSKFLRVIFPPFSVDEIDHTLLCIENS